MPVDVRFDAVPDEDATRVDGVDDGVGDEEICAVRGEGLTCFYDDVIGGGESDHEGGVLCSWEFPMGCGVGE